MSQFSKVGGHPQDIPVDAIAVTPSDSTTFEARGFYVGTAGNVTVVTKAGTTVLFKMVAGGQMNIAITKIKSTGTTATDIVALV